MSADPKRPPESPGASVLAVRYGLPLALVIAGGVLIGIGHGSTKSIAATTGLVLIGIAIMVWMINWMFRMSVSSNEDRVREEEARDYFSRHGHWPGEGGT